MQSSTLFQEVQKGASHPGWIIDSESEKEIILAVGDNTPERFDRWFTVKVLKPTGEMLQLERRDSGEDLWIPLASAKPGAPAGLRSKFDFDTFALTKTGLLTLKRRTNEFLLVPQSRFPGELRSVLVLDFQDQIYVARFSEPGGIGVEGFYDVCFQVKGGKVLTHSFELGGSLERVSNKVFMRSSAYIYDRSDKKVLKVKYGQPAMPSPVAMTNVLSPFAGKE